MHFTSNAVEGGDRYMWTIPVNENGFTQLKGMCQTEPEMGSRFHTTKRNEREMAARRESNSLTPQGLAESSLAVEKMGQVPFLSLFPVSILLPCIY